jgi:hypothetical protein
MKNVRTLTAICEGWGKPQDVAVTDRRVNAPLPNNWIGCGRSVVTFTANGNPRGAMWCVTCQQDGTAARQLNIAQSNFDTSDKHIR